MKVSDKWKDMVVAAFVAAVVAALLNPYTDEFNDWLRSQLSGVQKDDGSPNATTEVTDISAEEVEEGKP